MQRTLLIQHLLTQGCRLAVERERHTWWSDSNGTRRACIPRETEIANQLATKICNDLAVEQPRT